MSFALSEDQARVLVQIRHWIDHPDLPELTLGGYAGTGKTTMIKHLMGLNMRVAVCAFTGRAAYVLRSKGVPATTIHGLIYQPMEVCAETLLPVGDCEEHEGECVAELKFARVPEISADLIIVDEASMVSTRIYEDLMSFGVPTLFVGDHGQLEPIGDNPGLMLDPKLRLEKIHRQAEQSAIIQFAHHVRRGGRPRTMGPEAQIIRTARAPANVAAYDVVLCGRNKTRVEVNERIRRDRGFSGPLPIPGERVICLRNDNEHGIFNGMQATVVDLTTKGKKVLLTVEDDIGTRIPNLPIELAQFGFEKTLDHVTRDKTLWDFGYCLTVHKSQGGEWQSVCVLEWIHPNWKTERWRYTAATRASERLTYCLH